MRTVDIFEGRAHGGGVDLDTALLRAFVATSDEGHFGRAAGRLFITQQALSKRIARLERILGARVFDRTHHSVSLTSAGRDLLPHARQVIDVIDAAAMSAQSVVPLRVDVMDEHSAVVALVCRAAEANPLLTLETTERGDSGAAWQMLRAGETDLAFGRANHSPWPEDIRRRCALLEPIGVLAGPGHPLESRAHVTMDELRGIPLRFPLRGAPPDWVDLLDEFTSTFGITVDREGCSLGFDHFTDHVAEHPECATFFGMNMRVPADPRLRVVPIVEPTPVFPWAVMWRRNVPEGMVDPFVAPVPPTLPADAWMPAADRVWIDR